MTNISPAASPSANEAVAVAPPKQLGVEGNVQRWEEYWAGGGLAYEQGGPSVALKELLEIHNWLLPRGRCLIAGCGRGHDVVYMAKRGFDTTGIDICARAIDEAHKVLEASSATVGKVTLAVHDFLTFKPSVRFIMAYEYGLFSAIHPSQRQLWAEAYARLITPQGTLIVLLYPMIQRGQSPPYRATMADCERALKRYFVLVRVDSNCQCVEGQEGNELLSVWKRV
ncbi:S-adenosyl-L-methionine-dependent methyltransferase [Martensiomyces pterosporus]|nr:S-adenosyl-L-methionine-dependent methyltransferase [Martensiomyces pterosporus]